MILTDQGSFVLFTPESTEERAWIDDNVSPEGWQWLGSSLAVDSRYAGPLLDGMVGDGIEVTS